MDKPIISSSSNPLVKRVRALRQRKERAESGLFLVEGLHPVGEALEAGWDIDVILYAPDVLSSSYGSMLVERHASKLQPVSSAVMESVAEKENPQGILAVAHQRRAALGSLAALKRFVGMVSPQDPGNVGTVLRTMDATDTEALILIDGGVDPYHPTSVRASMGALFWKPIVQASFDDVVRWTEAQAIQRVGTSAHAQYDYRNFKPRNAWLLLLGSEQKGLSAEHLSACEATISLPMRGRASSLNLAVAAGILLYQFSA